MLPGFNISENYETLNSSNNRFLFNATKEEAQENTLYDEIGATEFQRELHFPIIRF